MSRVGYTPRKQRAPPSGLGDFLWSCMLDDYLSEEEEHEFARIVGKKEETSLLFCGQNYDNNRSQVYEDPRSIRIRGGGSNSYDDDIVADGKDGSPGFWKNDTPDVAPMVWLTLPPEQADGAFNEQNSQQNAITPLAKNPAKAQTTENSQLPRSRTTRSIGKSFNKEKIDPRTKVDEQQKRLGNRIRSSVDASSGSKASSQKGSKPSKERRGKSLTRERSEQRQPNNDQYSRQRSKSISRKASEQRQPRSEGLDRHGEQSRELGRKSTRSVGSRQRSLRSLYEKERNGGNRKANEDRSVKSSRRRSRSRSSLTRAKK